MGEESCKEQLSRLPLRSGKSGRPLSHLLATLGASRATACVLGRGSRHPHGRAEWGCGGGEAPGSPRRRHEFSQLQGDVASSCCVQAPGLCDGQHAA